VRRIALLCLTVFCTDCSSTQSQRVVTAAKPTDKAALLDRIKGLAGTWETEGPDGKKMTVVYQLTSSGSAVREIMFPGTGSEMTNMYTMDGPDLLMTHYCAMGNQPHMKASASQGNTIAFTTAGVSNLTAPDQLYMGQMNVVFVDKDHIRQEWQTIKNGALQNEMQTNIDLTRKQ
jgi:hypothetical protein